MKNKIVAIVGMSGSGKTESAEIFLKNGYQFLRFGQITMDIVKQKGLRPTEKNEKKIREGLRQELGMEVYAIKNIPKIDEMIKKGNVVIDGLYSWEEYKLLKNKYNNKLSILAIFASPKTRYIRLTKRKLEEHDKNIKNRPATIESARSRDFAEIENIQKAGPIAMAEYNIINESTIDSLKEQVKSLIEVIN